MEKYSARTEKRSVGRMESLVVFVLMLDGNLTFGRTRKAVGGAVVQRAVTALWVDGGFYDILGLAVVFLRELCDGGFEVVDFVDAGEVEHVVDLVCCEDGGICGRHGWYVWWVYTEGTRYSHRFHLTCWYGKFCGTCVTFFSIAGSSGRSLGPLVMLKSVRGVQSSGLHNMT